MATAAQQLLASPGLPITLDGSGSAGASGALLSYHWKQVQGPQVLLSNAFSAATSFVAPDFGDGVTRQYAFQLFVEDEGQTLVSEPAVASVVVGGASAGVAATVSLKPGLNVLSVPVNPASTHAYDLSDLVRDTGSPFVAYTGEIPNAGSGARAVFRVWQSGQSGPAPAVTATGGYVVGVPSQARSDGGHASVTWVGQPWPSTSFTRALLPGTNLLGVPLGLTASFDAEKLRSQLSSGFVARTPSLRSCAGSACRGLDVYVPTVGGSGPSEAAFPLTTGGGYLVNTPGATLDLRGP